MNWIKKAVFGALFYLLISLLALIILELALSKIMGLGQPIIYKADINWGYAPAPSQTLNRFNGSEVTINDKGLRNRIGWDKRSEIKAVVLGDSVTFGGSYIDDQEVFTGRLNSLKGIHKPIFYNAGVNAIGIQNMVARSRTDERLADANIVIFHFISDDFLRGFRGIDFGHFPLKQEPKIFPATWELLNFLFARYELKDLFGKGVKSSDLVDDEKEKYRAANYALENLEYEVRRLQRLDKRVYLVHSPVMVDLDADRAERNWDYALKLKLKAIFKDVYLQLHPVFVNHGGDLSELFVDDMHYSMLGHKKVSQFYIDHFAM